MQTFFFINTKNTMLKTQELKISNSLQKLDFSFKRNYLFLSDFKYFSKFFFSFLKYLNCFFRLKQFGEFNNLFFFSKEKNKKIKPFFLFIAEKHDFFFFSMFETFSKKLGSSFTFIPWSVSRFFFLLNKKKDIINNFYPILIISPFLLKNNDFLRVLPNLVFFPIFFFIENFYKMFSDRFSIYKNIFPIFLSKKNNLKFLLVFFKLIKHFI